MKEEKEQNDVKELKEQNKLKELNELKEQKEVNEAQIKLNVPTNSDFLCTYCKNKNNSSKDLIVTELKDEVDYLTTEVKELNSIINELKKEKTLVIDEKNKQLIEFKNNLTEAISEVKELDKKYKAAEHLASICEYKKSEYEKKFICLQNSHDEEM